MNILLTGGCGFIGSALVRHLIRNTEHRVLNLDKLTYAGHRSSVSDAEGKERYTFMQGDIADRDVVREAFAKIHPDAIIHLAAETHVDRSIDEPAAFVQTNVIGTYVLLEESEKYCRGQGAGGREKFRFLHVSTDEVFGPIEHGRKATETSPHRPSSPYAASKAAADHLVRSWHKTYGLPVLITNASNNYGPYQYPEKLIPLAILRALREEQIPVYGKGVNVRDWLYVDDHVEALMTVLGKGRPGETYNIGGNTEKENVEVVRALCTELDAVRPRKGGPSADLIAFVDDRPGHDLRYALDTTKVESELGWKPRTTFEEGLRKTVEWYVENGKWCGEVMKGKYGGERLGRSKT